MKNSKREENRKQGRENVQEIYGAASEAATRVATKDVCRLLRTFT